MLTPDTLINGRYRIIRAIGKGGMGAVYEAFDQRLHSQVALKQMIVEGDQLSRAFAREAQLLASLRHQALPRVIDHFVDDQGQFLVMDFIPGDDLATLLTQRGTPFPLEQALAWADTLLDALNYLHAQQPPVIHRDIKPQNMKLTPRGEIILLDFGLAKGAATAQTRSLTASVFGYTPQYAPLEQIKGSGTEPRSDLYSLAATIYNLITGTPPPDALTRAAAAVTREPDPLAPAHSINPAIPEEVSAILAQALSLDPAARFLNAAAMRRALQQALNSPRQRTAPPLVIANRPMAAPDIRPPAPPQPGPPAANRTTTPVDMTTPAYQSPPQPPSLPPPTYASAPAVEKKNRGLGICGILAIVALGLLIVVGIGITMAVRRIGEEVQQGFGQVLEQVTQAAPTFIAAQQTLEASAGDIAAQATAIAPTLIAGQQTAMALGPTAMAFQQTAVALGPTAMALQQTALALAPGDGLPLPVGEARPANTVPIAVGDLISGEIRAPETRLGYAFRVDEPQPVFVETRSFARGMEQVQIELVGPGGGQIFRTCLGCGNPGTQLLRQPGEYVLIISGVPDANSGVFEVQIHDVPPPRRFSIVPNSQIGAGQPNPDAGRISSPGAQQEYVIDGRPGQRIFIASLRYDQMLSQIGIRLLDPAGSEMYASCLGCGNPGLFALERPGNYLLVVGSNREATVGAYELGISTVPPPREYAISGDTLISGDQPAPGAGRIDTPGARNVYAFEAQPGQQITISIPRSDPSVSQLTVTLRAPSGAEIFSRCLGCGDPGPQTLSEGGRYVLIVGSDKDAGVGSYEIRVAPTP